ncbi:MAG: putative porin [Muribaculaceae bacterium]|nr:putative porin [Muribaculaceae bacterium]
MKKILSLILLSVCFVCTNAQRKPEAAPVKKQVIAPSYAWKIIEPLGLRETATLDTLPINYGQQSIPSMRSDAWATTGNFGAEGINMILSERHPISNFFFQDAIETWLPSVHTMKFYNTRIPMTLLSFNSAGGRDNSQERLSTIFSGNFNSKAQFGALLDYLYSKGCYNYQAAKNLVWGISGSYIGDRYEFQGYFNHWNSVNKENGGITDPLYITDPAVLQGGVTSIDPKSIPTRLTDAHTRIKGTDLLLNNRYKIGFWHEEDILDEEADTMKTIRTYIPVTSAIWTLRYRQGKHVFNNGSSRDAKEFFENTYLSPDFTDDRTNFTSVENTVGISLLEGFNKYAKFGLAAYLSYEIRKFKQTADTLARTEDLTPFPDGITSISPKATQNVARIGGQLTKQAGSILTYAATAEFGVLGAEAGDVRISGNVATRFKLFGDTVSIIGFGGFKNEAPPYLLNHYLSNHFIWDNDFGKIRRVNFGGTLDLPFSGTSISVEASNLQNYIYFNEAFVPQQHASNIQTFSARLDQRLQLGILHWDNRITYQKTSDEYILPLPQLAVYSNLYLKFKIATLYVQLGVDCDYYTKYYAPNYQPATASFANQHDIKLGNYPFMNAYANMKLSKTRFYVMFSHFNQGMFGGDNYFSLPNYPLNPRRFQIGLSIDFAN